MAMEYTKEEIEIIKATEFDKGWITGLLAAFGFVAIVIFGIYFLIQPL